MNRQVLIIVCMLGVLGGDSFAAEVRLKSQARTSTGIVRLGDVADVFAADDVQTQSLANIELGPAPAVGSRRFIRAREVQDALFMRGIHLGEHRLSGAERVEVQGPGAPAIVAEAPAKPKFRIDESVRERAERLVSEAVIRCLQKQAGEREPWQVKVELSDEQVTELCSVSRRVSAEGGVHPWTGTQTFAMRLDDGETSVRFDVTTEITLPPAVVAVVRDLPAGTIIHESDLTLKSVKNFPPGLRPFYRLQDVVGNETTWGIPAGTLLGNTSVRRPVVVRRGDAVTLYARSAGLRVRTTVRSREDGALGALIAVESLAGREVFYARVTGIQEAEVVAVPAAAEAPRPAAETMTQSQPVAAGGVR